MEQNGKPMPLSVDEFPWRHAIDRGTIHEEFHFVVPKKHMLSYVRTMADFGHDYFSWATIAGLSFVAEACTNVIKHRGDFRPDHIMPGLEQSFASRITPILTYVPLRTHTEGGDTLSPEELLADKNIAAYVFSVLVRDDQLKLSYAFADQIDINRYGAPSHRKKGEGDDTILVDPVAVVPPPAIPDDDRLNLVGPAAFDGESESSSSESEEVPAAAPVAAAPINPRNAGNRNNIDADMYQSLDAYGSRFWYPKRFGIENMWSGKLSRAKANSKSQMAKQRPTLHKKIKTSMTYVNIMGAMINKIDAETEKYVRYTGDSSRFTVASIPEDDPLHYKNCFSLDAAVAKLVALGAAPAFCDLRRWSDLNGNFVIPLQLDLHVAAQLRIGDFNAASLFTNCLPHCQIMDKYIIRPQDEFGLTPSLTLESGRQMNVESMFGSIGVVLEHNRLDQLRGTNEFWDVWQQYFEQFRSIELSLQKKVQAEGYTPLSPQLLKKLNYFREQGFARFAAVNHLQNRGLPDGNKAILQWRIKKGDIKVPVLHLFEPLSDDTMSPFSQWRANELLFAESILKVADFMVLLFPKMLLSASMVWLPFMNGTTNKEHLQFIGPPGSMKSDTLSRVQRILIPGTYSPKSGGSKKGILGPHRSQRIIEIYHELNSVLAPSCDPTSSDKEVIEMKLTQLSEGLYIYETSMEDPKTNERLDVRKVSHFTNILFGAKNPSLGRRELSRDGAAAAMLDRNSILKIIPTAHPGRQTISERVFQDFMHATRNSAMPRDIFQVIQLAVSDYCCMMSCYAVPLPNIELFSNIAPNAIGYLATMHPELANRLRDISRIKTRLYAEILTDMARYGVCSAIGLAGRALRDGVPYIYKTEEAVREMSKYAYTDYEKMVFVLSSSVYDMSEGQYNSIAATFILETSDYTPYGAGREGADDEADFAWPEALNLDELAANNIQASRIAAMANNISNWSLEQVLDEVVKEGKNYLGTPKFNKAANECKDQQYVMREHNCAAHPNSDPDNQRMKFYDNNVDLDLFNVVAGITNENPEPPRLERNYNCENLFKHETIGANTYVNFNYIRINGSPDTYANSFSDNVGGRVMTPQTIKDIILTLKNTKVITPYIPIMPSKHNLVLQHPGYVQALRHSYTALRRLKLFNVPVVIEDNNRFYMLAAYAETNPAVVIAKMVESMCYEATRETRTVIGVPSRETSLDFMPVSIKPRPGVSLTVARKSNLSPANFARLQKQFDLTEADIDGYSVDGIDSVYKTVDIEEQMALRAILYAHPELTLEKAQDYTPRGVWRRFYGPDGIYRDGNPYTVEVRMGPEQASNKRKNGQAPRASKRRQQANLAPIKRTQHAAVPGIDMRAPRARTQEDEFMD